MSGDAFYVAAVRQSMDRHPSAHLLEGPDVAAISQLDEGHYRWTTIVDAREEDPGQE